MDDSEIAAKAICILGMHRSGTSVITRAINLLGVYLGEGADLMAPGPDNPHGYWELNEIVNLHDRLLDQVKKRWDTTTPLPAQWEKCKEIQPMRNELIDLIKKTFSEHKLWAWKDPRTSILLPIWRDVLDELGIELVVVFAIRNPLDVALSLKKREGFPYDKSFGIWFHYNIAALGSVLGLPFLFVHYDRILNNWESELKRCAGGLGIPWPEDQKLLRKKMNEFIRHELRHSLSSTNELRRSGAPYPVMELYEVLENEKNVFSKSDAPFQDKIKELSKEFSSYVRFFQYDMKKLWERNRLLDRLNIQLAEKDRQLAERDRQLAESNRTIRMIINSRSWRITAPLRKVFSLIFR